MLQILSDISHAYDGVRQTLDWATSSIDGVIDSATIEKQHEITGWVRVALLVMAVASFAMQGVVVGLNWGLYAVAAHIVYHSLGRAIEAMRDAERRDDTFVRQAADIRQVQEDLSAALQEVLAGGAEMSNNLSTLADLTKSLGEYSEEERRHLASLAVTAAADRATQRRLEEMCARDEARVAAIEGRAPQTAVPGHSAWNIWA